MYDVVLTFILKKNQEIYDINKIIKAMEIIYTEKKILETHNEKS